jgi:hypothetical protein
MYFIDFGKKNNLKGEKFVDPQVMCGGDNARLLDATSH